jgi:SAM-dependent methyltransferase
MNGVEAVGSYVFDDVASTRELERLRAIESIFDPKTRDMLRATGELAGRRFLEVGAGAGSIARFMHAEVGPKGRVVAVDSNSRFLVDLGGVEIVVDDIRKVTAGSYESDIVHARYVLIHNTAPGDVLDAMLDQLVPGGYVLLEEPDFLAARPVAGPDAFIRAHAAVSHAIEAMFRERAMDPALGLNLARLLRERGVELVAVECETHVARGGSPIARMMRLSTQQLAEKYTATGAVTVDEIAAHLRFADDPACWAIHYATLRALGRKPTS